MLRRNAHLKTMLRRNAHLMTKFAAQVGDNISTHWTENVCSGKPWCRRRVLKRSLCWSGITGKRKTSRKNFRPFRAGCEQVPYDCPMTSASGGPRDTSFSSFRTPWDPLGTIRVSFTSMRLRESGLKTIFSSAFLTPTMITPVSLRKPALSRFSPTREK